jgi:mannose-1-phosphate guanylyltransferase
MFVWNAVLFLNIPAWGDGVHLKDKLVFGRYCVDKSGATIDLQKAALDWLITDSRCEVPPGLVSATPTN